jgi:competence ComEA-like helix-hairpin-helix protein
MWSELLRGIKRETVPLFVGLFLTLYLGFASLPASGRESVGVRLAGRVEVDFKLGLTVGEALASVDTPERGCVWEKRWDQHLLAPGDEILVPCFRDEGPLVNVNAASEEELMSLPGIGEVLSRRIVEHRREFGPYLSVEDLKEVSGIGEKRLKRIYNLITT